MMENHLLLSKKQLNYIKYILLSPICEQILLLIYIITLFLLLVLSINNNFLGFQSSQKMQSLLLEDINILKSSNKIEDVKLYLTNHFPINYQQSPDFQQVGPLLLIQIRVPPSQNCLYFNGINEYSSDCNIYFKENLEDLQPSKISMNNMKYCLSSNCEELNKRTFEIGDLQTKWRKIPKKGFYTQIFNENNEETKILMNNLIKGDWLIKGETKIIIFCFNFLAIPEKILFNNIYIFEFPVNDYLNFTPISRRISIHGDSDPLQIIVIPLLLFTCLIFFIKILFEINYISNRFIAFLNLFILISNIILAIVLILENSAYEKLNIDFSINNIGVLDNVMKYQLAIKLFFSISIFFFPFKLFEFLSWKNCVFIIKISKTLYRTIKLLLILLYFIIPLSLSWSLAFYYIFKDYLVNFETFPRAFLSFFFFYGEFEQIKAMEIFPNFFIYYAFMQILKLLLFAFFLSFLMNSYFYASEIEFSHQQTADNIFKINFYPNIYHKIEKFEKKFLPESQLIRPNKLTMMAIWLSKGCFSSVELDFLESKNRENGIKLILFYSETQIIEFLNYMFRLKPNLAFKADSLFRVCLEVNEEKPDFEKILQWLGDFGSKVPVLLYFQNRKERVSEQYLKKIYKYLLFTSLKERSKDFIFFKSLGEIEFDRQSDNEEDLTEYSQSQLDNSFMY